MRNRGDNRGGTNDTPQYSSQQVEVVLHSIGVDIDYETVNDFVAFCPFHGNRHTASFSVSRTSGSYICFNGSCNVSGSLVDLVKKLSDRNEFEARRLIISKKNSSAEDFAEQLKKALNPLPDFAEFPLVTIERMTQHFWENEKAITYMRSRGFSDETLRKYSIGWSDKKGLIVVPMHNSTGMPIGLIGRTPSKDDKQFKNSTKLPTSKTLFNIHRARRQGESVIVTEASFDAMRVDQAGYPNVVSCLSGNVSPYHIDQLERHFNTIIIMTDFDKKEKHMYNDCGKCAKRGWKLCHGHNPGRDLGAKIAANLPMKRVLWAAYDEKLVYPHDAKDAGDMTDDEIRQCLRNAVTNFEYMSWDLY